ncbi:hypothetical protein D3C85_1570670 [compost metagenome]
MANLQFEVNKSLSVDCPSPALPSGTGNNILATLAESQPAELNAGEDGIDRNPEEISFVVTQPLRRTRQPRSCR